MARAERHASRRALLYAALLVLHTAVTARALMDKSYLELFAFAFQGWPAGQIFSDLTVSITLVSSPVALSRSRRSETYTSRCPRCRRTPRR